MPTDLAVLEGRSGRIATVTRLVPHGSGLSDPVPMAAVQGTLALDLGGRLGPPAVPEHDPTLAARVRSVDDAEVTAWAGRFAQALVEAVGGDRPVSQLLRWVSPGVYRDLDRRVRLLGLHQRADLRRRTVRPQVRSVHVFRPSPTVAEVAVHVRYGQRSRALAARLQRREGRWCCVALELG